MGPVKLQKTSICMPPDLTFKGNALLRYGLTCAGDYDYDDSHELPAGCHYLDEQTSDAAGSHVSTSNDTAHMTNDSAPAPAPQAATGNATSASATQLALRGNSSTKRHGPATMLCKPIAAAEDRLDKVFIICITVIPGSIVILAILSCIIAANCKRQR